MTNSKKIHSPRNSIKPSRRAKSQKTSRLVYTLSKRMTILIIFLSVILVLLTLLIVLLSNPKRNIKSEIEKIATNYYETYLYSKTVAPLKSFDPNNLLSTYEKSGLTRIPLRQLLLFDDNYSKESIELISKYCDADNTFAKIFPTPPYNSTDYRVEYSYTCNF
ncbi:MAG: hypothetical protein Q4A79_00765 [Candidatus Saccharibacteria bacterium]|nr:hypothetical protein [Candidatus Saccharibacteria bacterium]